MPSLCTRYILRSESETPSDEEFEQVLQRLAKILRSEMRHRGLFNAPPRFLGIVGASWNERDTFTDLLHDAFAFSILDRLKALRRLAKNSDIDGVIRKNVRLFLFERQKQQDPIGYRVFDITRAAVDRAIEKDWLESNAGDGEKTTASTLLGPPPLDLLAAPEPLDDELTGRWAERLMPDLVMAFRRQGVINRFSELFSDLGSSDISAFLLRDLVEPMKKLARERSVALVAAGDLIPPRAEDPSFDFLVRPNDDFAQRQSLKRLIDCVRSSIDGRPNVKERSYLSRLLDFLAFWSAMMDEGSVRGRPGDAEISRRLDIPRGRVPELLETLSKLTSACREGRGLSASSGKGMGKEARSKPMDQEKRREALKRATAAKIATVDQAAEDGSIHPADIVTWSADGATEPTEWLVVTWSDSGGRLVPVDSAPLHGSRDLDLSAAAGEPLFARCGQSLEIPTEGATDLRASWRLPKAGASVAIERIHGRLSQLAEETPPVVDVDETPIYLEHIEAIEKARALLKEASALLESSKTPGGTEQKIVSFEKRVTEQKASTEAARSRQKRFTMGSLIAATLALVVAGLGTHTVRLQDRLDVASAELGEARKQLGEMNVPRFIEPSPLHFARTRGHRILSPQNGRVIYEFELPGNEEDYEAYELKLTDPNDNEKVLLEKPLLFLSSQIIELPVARASFRLALYGLRDDDSVVEIHSEILKVVPEEKDTDSY